MNIWGVHYMRLSNSELKVMEVVWNEKYINEKNEIQALEVAKVLEKELGWKRNTTYTVLKKLIDKGAIERYYPNYTIKPLVSKEEIAITETERLIDGIFKGSAINYLSTFLSTKKLSSKDIEEIKKMLDKLDKV